MSSSNGASKEDIIYHIIEIIQTYDPLDEICMSSQAWEHAPDGEREASIFVRTMIEEIVHSKEKLMGKNVTEH